MGKTHRRVVLDQHDFPVAPKMPKYLRERSDYDAIPTTHIYKYTPDSQHKIEIPVDLAAVVVPIKKRKLSRKST